MHQEHLPYVVFVRRDPSRFVRGHAENWQQARELGAKRLRVRSEDVWAVAPRDGETDEAAVSREVGELKGGGK